MIVHILFSCKAGENCDIAKIDVSLLFDVIELVQWTDTVALTLGGSLSMRT